MGGIVTALVLAVGGLGGLAGIAALVTAIVAASKRRSEVEESEARGAEIAQKAALAAQTFYSGTIAHQNERIEQLAGRVRDLERSRDDAEYRAAIAEDTVRGAKAWVDAGCPPPPFVWPEYAYFPASAASAMSAHTPATVIRPPINRQNGGQ